MSRWLRLGALFAAAMGAAHGADIGGIWVGQVDGRNGDKQDVAFRFKATPTGFTGKLYGDYQSTPVLEGKLQGDQVTFAVLAQEQSGNQINETRLTFTGTLQGGVMELTRERGTSTNAGNAGAVQFRGNTTQTIRLRRLL